MVRRECGGTQWWTKNACKQQVLVAVGGKACGGEKHEHVCITMC